MRITKNQLRQIIKEELGRVLGEGRPSRPPKERRTRREPDPRYPGEIVPFIQHAQGTSYRDEHQEDLLDQLLQLKTQDLGSGLTSFGRDQMQAIESELEMRKTAAAAEEVRTVGYAGDDPEFDLSDPDAEPFAAPVKENRRRRKIRKTRKK